MKVVPVDGPVTIADDRGKSSGVAVLVAAALVWLFLLAGTLVAHETRPAIANVSISANEITLDLRLTLEAVVAGVDLDGLADTDLSPKSADYDRLRAMEPAALEQAFRARWPAIAKTMRVKAGEQAVELRLTDVKIPDAGNLALPRDSEITLRGVLPSGDAPVTVGWDKSNGPLVVRQAGAGDDAYAGYLTKGETSAPMPRVGVATEDAMTVFVRYIVIGFEHIIPKGLDHILFVLGLFFLSTHWKPLVVQVSVFTLAHTVTLALASLGVISLSPSIVEPLIAASIVYVAVENIFARGLHAWRTAVVFAFGLLHGLGFASVLGDVGLEPARFVLGLIGFNIGVELGQLAVIGIAFLVVGWWAGGRSWYHARVATPASLVIACVGLFWFVERVI